MVPDGPASGGSTEGITASAVASAALVASVVSVCRCRSGGTGLSLLDKKLRSTLHHDDKSGINL